MFPQWRYMNKEHCTHYPQTVWTYIVSHTEIINSLQRTPIGLPFSLLKTIWTANGGRNGIHMKLFTIMGAETQCLMSHTFTRK